MSRDYEEYEDFDEFEGYEDYELSAHKKSDTIKWVIAFTLIAVLLIGMITSIVMVYKGRFQEKVDSEQEVVSQTVDGEIESAKSIVFE